MVFFNSPDILFFLVLDIVISLYVVIVLEYDSWKNRLIFIMLIPFGSFTSILFGDVNIGAIELINIPVFIYLMKIYLSELFANSQLCASCAGVLLHFVFTGNNRL